MRPPWRLLGRTWILENLKGGQMRPLLEAKIQNLIFFGGFEKIKKTLVFIGSEPLTNSVFFCFWHFWGFLGLFEGALYFNKQKQVASTLIFFISRPLFYYSIDISKNQKNAGFCRGCWHSWSARCLFWPLHEASEASLTAHINQKHIKVGYFLFICYV